MEMHEFIVVTYKGTLQGISDPKPTSEGEYISPLAALPMFRFSSLRVFHEFSFYDARSLFITFTFITHIVLWPHSPIPIVAVGETEGKSWNFVPEIY